MIWQKVGSRLFRGRRRPAKTDKGKRGDGLRSLLRLVGMAAAVTAVVKELRTPADRRQWHGALFGVVPYDFRLPTLDRLRAKAWNPDSDRLLNPAVFGVGWTLNLGRLVRLVRS